MLMLLASLAHAGPVPFCPPSRCVLSYLDADAHISDPYASGRYPVVIAVYSSAARVTVDGTATSAISASTAARYGISRAELSGAISITAGTSSINASSRTASDWTADVNVVNVGATDLYYQIWIIR